MKLFEWMFMFSVVVFFVVMPTSWAQGSPPETRDCENTIDVNDYNARLDCKTENVNSALFGFVDRVIELDQLRISTDRPGLFTEDQKNNLLTVRERAQNAKNRTNVAKGFKGAVKKQKSQDEDCYTKELDNGSGDGDGVCEKNETCEEVIGDNIGDDDGECSMKGNEKEVCVQVCQQPLLDDDENYDPEALSDMEEELTELEESLNNAGVQVEMLMMVEKEAWEQGILYEATLSDSCGDFSDNSLSWWTFGVLQGLQVVKNVASGAFNSCSVVCNQDAFGWNCEAGCLALAIVSGAADIIYDGADLGFKVGGEIDAAAQMEKMAECIQENKSNVTSIKDDVVDLKIKAKETGDSLVRVEEELALLKTLLEQNQSLLLTPHGQKDGFPLND